MSDQDEYTFQFTQGQLVFGMCISIAICCCYTGALWLFAGGTCCRTKPHYVMLADVQGQIPLRERLQSDNDNSSNSSVDAVIHERHVSHQ